MKQLTLGSLFSGSGGFELAGVLHHIRPVWASEIEPFPIRVTTLRFPEMKHLGDVTKIDGSAIEPVDIITFGSPCTDVSIAGTRTGIHKGKQSSLFFDAIRIIREMRYATDNQFPRFAVWENVKGAFSCNKGADFRAVLQSFCDLVGGGIQYLCLKKENGRTQDASWETVSALPGVSTMLSTGACPSVGRESSLLRILDRNAPEKYSLSPRAARGILTRSERRGQSLPPIMQEALEEVIAMGAA